MLTLGDETMNAPVRTKQQTQHRYLSTMSREHGFEPLRVEGDVPAALRGTLYRVGPGLYESHGRSYEHPFEGDGAVCAVRFGAEVTGSHRVVQTAALVAERHAGKPLFNSVASWPRRLANGVGTKFKNCANTNLMWWQERLFALYEPCLPTELNRDLDTSGETDLDGVVPMAFSAHPHAVRGRNAIYSFGARYAPLPRLDIFELPDRGPARRLSTLKLDHPVMLHDFIATDRHLIFFVSPARLQIARAMFGINPFDKLIKWSPQDGTEVIVVPIDTPNKPVRFRVDAFFQWHFAGAFERDGELFVDIVEYPNLDSMQELSSDDIATSGRFTRVRVDLQKKRLHHEALSESRYEFPKIDPRHDGGDYSRVWMMSDLEGTSAVTQIDPADGSTVTHPFEPGVRCSEPVFVPRSSAASEGDGWILSLNYDVSRHQSHIAIIDTARFEDAPVARVFLDHHVPMTFHGLWVDQPA
jgi:all-trans-8'-apo-beta-carotenal 15,15'-oxygenase